MACVVAAAALAANAEEPAPPDGYRLVWSDEFNVDGPPNPDNWGYERGFVRNEELQWYQPENAVCRDGLLVIEARREQMENPRYRRSSRDWRQNRPVAEYTSAALLTRGKHAWKYGRFVMRARIDTRPGLWPAFWTLGTEGRWPRCGEIDVMEYYSGMLLANVAWLGENHRTAWDDSRHPIEEFDAGWVDEFHVWQLDWDEERIKISVDGGLLNETPLEGLVNADRERSEPFQQPHYLILNLAIGGTNGGDPTPTEFPATLEVDYVQVFQRQ